MIYENLEVSGSLRSDRVVNRPPRGARASRPTNPRSGSLFLETTTSGSNYLMLYTGVSNIDDGWERIAAQETQPTVFRYRQVINYSYLAGGYKDGSPWKNVHKTVNLIDQTTHIGELLDYPASYTSGACNKNIFFVWSVNSDGGMKYDSNIQGTYTSAINMLTDTKYTNQTKFNNAIERADLGTMHKETEFAYLFAGGSSTMEKFNLSNESLVTGFGLTTINNNSGGASAFSDENFGYGWTSSDGIKFNFSNETASSSTLWSAHGQQKGISSKYGKGYCGNEGSYNGGYNLRRWSNASDTNIGNVAKPYANCGEENFTMGQDWQYMLGNYDGAQNNGSWKFYYASDTGSSSVTGLNPAVNAGTSSGHCGWRQ